MYRDLHSIICDSITEVVSQLMSLTTINVTKDNDKNKVILHLRFTNKQPINHRTTLNYYNCIALTLNCYKSKRVEVNERLKKQVPTDKCEEVDFGLRLCNQ